MCDGTVGRAEVRLLLKAESIDEPIDGGRAIGIAKNGRDSRFVGHAVTVRERASTRLGRN